MYNHSKRLRLQESYLADGQRLAGYIAVMLAAAAAGIAAYLRTSRRNAKITAGLHQWGDIWFACQPGQQLTLATVPSVLLMGLSAAIFAGILVWCVFLLFKPYQSFRRRFNFCAVGLLSALVCADILYMPLVDRPVIIDRTHGWITGGSIPEGYSLSFSQIKTITTLSTRSFSAQIDAVTADELVNLLTVLSTAQAQNVASLMKAFMNGQSVAIAP